MMMPTLFTHRAWATLGQYQSFLKTQVGLAGWLAGTQQQYFILKILTG